MGVHGGRARGHIEIVAEIIGGDLVGDLDQPAFKADLRVEREGRLILGDVARPDEGLRRRVIAHREKQIGIGREAGAALSECGHRLGFPVLAGHVQATAARDVAMLATKSSKVWCMKSIWASSRPWWQASTMPPRLTASATGSPPSAVPVGSLFMSLWLRLLPVKS